jgi:hypothetical protein
VIRRQRLAARHGLAVQAQQAALGVAQDMEHGGSIASRGIGIPSYRHAKHKKKPPGKPAAQT